MTKRPTAINSRLAATIVIIIILIQLVASAQGGPLVAYSLKEAERLLRSGHRKDKELMELGQITRIGGMVYDKENNDIILVGQAASSKDQKLTLNDLTVAMRALMLHNQWPLVSIDEVPETKITNKQKIRFNGGLQDTSFGKVMLDADVVLKKIAMGRLTAEIWGVRSYFDRVVDEVQTKGDQWRISTRFWFYPIRPSIAVRENVFAINDLQIGVRTQFGSEFIDGKPVENPDDTHDKVGELFAEEMTNNYSDLAAYYPEIARLKQLFDIVAIAEGIRSLPQKPDLSYWLEEYTIPCSETLREYPLLIRQMDVESSDKGIINLKISGGVELKALVLRLQDGDVTALRDVVLKSRPTVRTLCWYIPIDGWEMPGYQLNPVDKENVPLHGISASTSKFGCSITSEVGRVSSKGIFTENVSTRSPQVEAPSFSRTSRLLSQRYSSNVGGVMLQGSAKASGGKDAHVDLSDGTFSLVVDGQNARLDPKMFRKFVTVLWAVYFGRTVPGISIDPIYQDPETGYFSDKHMVRYIGRVVNTDLGRVMRQADYQMKKWSVGTEKPNIPGFETPEEYAARTGKFYASLSRFWLTPENMQFKASDNMLLFDEGNMTVKTEVLGYDVGEKPANPQNEAFARSFTKHYDEIAQKYPIYKELADYGKLVALAKYLKDSRIPLLWFLMANKDLILTEDSPGTVNNLAKESDYWRGITIQGGVDMSEGGRYVYDDAAVKAIEKAWEKAGSRTTHSMSMTGAKQRAPSIPFSFEMGTNQYTVVPQHSLTCGKDRRGIRYQTDLCLRAEGYKVTEKVVDVMKSEILRQAVQRQLRLILEEMSDEEAEEKSQALIAQCYKKALKNEKALMEKVEGLSGQKYETADECAAAWKKAMVGAAAVELQPMFVAWCHYVSNLELVRYFDPDCQGNSQFGKGWHLLIPYQIEPAGQTKTEFLNILIPEKMAVKNLLTGEQEVLTFSTDRYSTAGYVPDKLHSSQVVGLFIMSDASYRLTDKLGNEFCFDPAGYLTDMSFSQDHRVHFEYLHTFTEDFEQLPYQLEAVGKEQVEFLNILLPKAMVVKDLVNGSSEVLTFSDKSEISGYVPENKENSRFKILILMSDGSFRLHDKKGNEIVLSAAGDFKCFAVSSNYPIVKSVSTGPYKVNFKYTIDNSGKVLIANANLSEKGKAKPLYTVNYEYDEEGRLCKVDASGLKLARK